MGAPVLPIARVHEGECLIPISAMFGVARLGGSTIYTWYLAEREQNHRLTHQSETPHRCAYCQTLHLTTAAVRCSSCGAPR